MWWRRVPQAAEYGLLAGLAVVAYTYVGYPLLVRVVAGRRPARPAPPPRPLPSMTVLVCALDEQAVIEQKIANSRALDYPPDRLEVLVVADGSQDRTPHIARQLGARVLHGEGTGKAAAVNRGVAAARGELVCLTDANCALAPGSLQALAEAFADPRVAVVSGAKTVQGPGVAGAGEGAYWRLESLVKQSEATLGSTVGAPGEVCGLRRSTFRPIPAGVLNDDYHLTCDALVRGLRVGYAPGARSVEAVSAGLGDELERRTRIAAGTWQTTLSHLALCSPRHGWTAVAFVSHRVLRSLVVPPLLPLLWLGSLVAARRSPLARGLLAAQTLGCALAAGGVATDARPVALPFQFVLTNLATLRGARRYLRGQQPLVWQRASRGGWLEDELGPGSCPDVEQPA